MAFPGYDAVVGAAERREVHLVEARLKITEIGIKTHSIVAFWRSIAFRHLSTAPALCTAKAEAEGETETD